MGSGVHSREPVHALKHARAEVEPPVVKNLDGVSECRFWDFVVQA